MDFFRKINNGYMSGSKKESTLFELRRSIAANHKETVDYQPGTLVDGVPVPLIVMEPRGGGNEKDRLKKIEAPPGSVFRLGSKVGCFGLMWLVTEVNYNQEIKLQGVMKLCNYALSWQEADGSVVVEDCVVSRYQTAATGEDAGKVVSLDNTRRNVLVQFNERTARLRQGMRFFIDLEGLGEPKVYRLTDLDRTSFILDGVGLFRLVCAEDEVVPGDRPDLMLADYIEPVSVVASPSIGSCKIVFNGDAALRVGGSQKEFRAVFFDGSGAEILSLSPSWDVVLPPGLDVNQISVLCQSDPCVVRVGAVGGAGHKFMLRVVADDYSYGYFESEVPLSVVPLW